MAVPANAKLSRGSRSFKSRVIFSAEPSATYQQTYNSTQQRSVTLCSSQWRQQWIWPRGRGWQGSLPALRRHEPFYAVSCAPPTNNGLPHTGFLGSGHSGHKTPTGRLFIGIFICKLSSTTGEAFFNFYARKSVQRAGTDYWKRLFLMSFIVSNVVPQISHCLRPPRKSVPPFQA